jgi:hypothetical protein
VVYAVSVGLTEEVKSQKAPYWVCRMKAMRLSRASVADAVGGQSVTKEKPKRCCYEVTSCVRTAIRLKCRAEEKGGSTTRVRTHNLQGPFSDSCFQVHYVIVVCRWECIWFRGFYCRPRPAHIRKRSPFLCLCLHLHGRLVIYGAFCKRLVIL